MKPTENFRMKKETKRIIALGKLKNPNERVHWKQMMIQAQLHEEKAKQTKIKESNKIINDE
jgi:hypothetical protein